MCDFECLNCNLETCIEDKPQRPRKYIARPRWQPKAPESPPVTVPPLKDLLVDAKTYEPIRRQE